MKYIRTFDIEVYPPKSDSLEPILQCDLTTGEVSLINAETSGTVEYIDSEQVHGSDYYETVIRMLTERDDLQCSFTDEGFICNIPGVINFSYILTAKTAIVTLYGYNQESMFDYKEFFNKVSPKDLKILITARIE